MAECHGIIDQLQDEIGHAQSTSAEQRLRTEQTLRSIQSKQNECAILHARLSSRISQIEEEWDVLKGDLLSMKNDVSCKCIGCW